MVEGEGGNIIIDAADSIYEAEKIYSYFKEINPNLQELYAAEMQNYLREYLKVDKSLKAQQDYDFHLRASLKQHDDYYHLQEADYRPQIYV